MGDRGNVNVRESPYDKGVFLYSHWGGSDLLLLVKRALVRGADRWQDTPYLTRIIFCEMLKGRHYNDAEDALDGTTGFGISTEECDPEHPTILLDISRQTIQVAGAVFTFHEYVDKNWS